MLERERGDAEVLEPRAVRAEAAALGLCRRRGAHHDAERVERFGRDVGVEVDTALAVELHADAAVCKVDEEGVDGFGGHLDALNLEGVVVHLYVLWDKESFHCLMQKV